jgi:Amt family ammonium transporter
VVGVHLAGGALGVVLIGPFASLAINAAGAAASASLFGKQVVLALVTVAYSFLMTLVLLKVSDLIVGLRVSAQDEGGGLDSSEHGEAAYLWIEVDTPPPPM